MSQKQPLGARKKKFWTYLVVPSIVFLAGILFGFYIGRFGTPTLSMNPKDWGDFFSICITPLTFLAGLTALSISYRNYRVGVQNQEVSTKLKMLETLTPRFELLKKAIEEKRGEISQLEAEKSENGLRRNAIRGQGVLPDPLSPSPPSTDVFDNNIAFLKIQISDKKEALNVDTKEESDMKEIAGKLISRIESLSASASDDLSYYRVLFEIGSDLPSSR